MIKREPIIEIVWPKERKEREREIEIEKPLDALLELEPGGIRLRLCLAVLSRHTRDI